MNLSGTTLCLLYGLSQKANLAADDISTFYAPKLPPLLNRAPFVPLQEISRGIVPYLLGKAYIIVLPDLIPRMADFLHEIIEKKELSRAVFMPP